MDMKNQVFKSTEFQKSQEKAEKILTGATAEFLANGYAATSMDRIAIVSGVSKATVYKYFKDKRRLFEILIEKLARAKFEAVKELINSQSPQERPKTTISNIATKLLSDIGDDYNFQNLMRIVVAESGRSPELAVVYVNNFAKPAINILTNYFKSHPQLNIPDEEATARIFIGTLVHHVILQKLLYGSEIVPLKLNYLVNTLTDLIVFSK
jgi:TetR/AcrR family transcriptional regulator of autoinduction and epiphytic fitness